MVAMLALQPPVCPRPLDSELPRLYMPARRAEKDEDERLDRYVLALTHRERSRPRSWTTCYVVAT